MIFKRNACYVKVETVDKIFGRRFYIHSSPFWLSNVVLLLWLQRVGNAAEWNYLNQKPAKCWYDDAVRNYPKITVPIVFSNLGEWKKMVWITLNECKYFCRQLFRSFLNSSKTILTSMKSNNITRFRENIFNFIVIYYF